MWVVNVHVPLQRAMLLVAFILVGGRLFGIQSTAAAPCTCIFEEGLEAALGEKATLEMNGVTCLPIKLASGLMGCYPADYGARCKKHDELLPATCADMQGRAKFQRPDWCTALWCYVDKKDNCGPAFPSHAFVGLYYSYESCGSKNSYEAYVVNEGQTVGQMTTVIQSYVKSAAQTAIDTWTGISSGSCSPVTGCTCTSCVAQTSGKWVDQSIDTAMSAYFLKQGAMAGDKEKCLVSFLHGTYEHIAAKEDASQRLGYMYFGSQGDGSMIQWPAMDWCPVETDFRFRPWYSSAASGPKDVVIVIDVSGSMRGKKNELAIAAAKAVIDTLVDSDWAAVVIYSSGPGIANAATLQAMSSEVKPDVMRWIDANVGASGGTQFKQGFTKAFDVLKASRSSGSTSGCRAVVLFLSDGNPSDWASPSLEESYAWLKERTEDVGDAMILSYALGDGITSEGKTILKRIACDNRGVYHEVAEDGNLGDVMANYYSFLAVGTDSAKARWREYEDAVSKQTLLAACTPAFDKRQSPRKLLGVACMDMNALTDLADFKKAAGYSDFEIAIREEQRFCAPFRLSHLDAQLLRFNTNPSAVCEEVVRCGDGIVNGMSPASKEACDDGNAGSGDGCSSTCQVETGWVCPRWGYEDMGNGYLRRKQVICGGQNLALSSAQFPEGIATEWDYCRSAVLLDACSTWCQGQTACKGFNYYEKAWGHTKLCCFRSLTGSNEFHSNTQCYEKIPSADAGCQDDWAFVDEQSFKCHEWQGYNCDAAVSDWGYSVQGQLDLKEKCKNSCGVCSGAMCRPRCSKPVAQPSDCNDCLGDWQQWGPCSNGVVVQKPGGRAECVQERTYKVVSVAKPGGADCSFADGEKDHRVVDIFRPTAWSQCMTADNKVACGSGTKTRQAPCVAPDQAMCATFASDFAPTTSEACQSNAGCEWQATQWSVCSGGRQTRTATCESGTEADCAGKVMLDVDRPCAAATSSTTSPVQMIPVFALAFVALQAS